MSSKPEVLLSISFHCKDTTITTAQSPMTPIRLAIINSFFFCLIIQMRAKAFHGIII